MSWTKFFKAAGKAITAIQAQQPAARPKSVPIMTMDMIDNNNQPISTAEAVKLFKEFSLKTGHLSKEELAEHGRYFSDEIREHAESLKEDSTGDLANIKEQIKDAKARRKIAKDEEQKLEIDEELESLQLDLASEIDSTKAALAELAEFKADKRAFLIGYTNRQTQNQ